jgi:hypothetical protein
MEIYCIDRFKSEFEKLKSKRSYKSIQKEMSAYFWDKSREELASGVRLNHSEDAPYIKKRLGGSGGYRFYFLLLTQNDRLILMFVHPKTGSMGVSNIDDKSKALIYKQVLEAVKSNNLFKLNLDSTTQEITFEPTEEKTKIASEK